MSIYGLIVGIALSVGIDYFLKHNKYVSTHRPYLFVTVFLLIVFVGARAYHVADSWDYYSVNLSQIPNTRAGGLGILGGMISGTVFLLIYSKVNRINLLSLFDSITPILPLCQSIGRFGNYFNNEVYSPTGQPVWAYESFMNLLLFLTINKYKSTINPTAIYLIGFGAIRFVLEFLREDTWKIMSVKVAQVIAIIFILTGILIWKSQKNQTISKQP